jgi:hypothetical protein
MKNFMQEAVAALRSAEEAKKAEERQKYLEEKKRLRKAVLELTGREAEVAEDITINLDGIRFRFDTAHSLSAVTLCPRCGNPVRGKVVRSLVDVGWLIRSSEGYPHRCVNGEWHEFHFVEEDE